MQELNTISLFNENGDDSPASQELINGNTTGISNLNENKFKWANNLYRSMVGNHWVPEKVPLEDDKISIKELTKEEDIATKETLSFLIFLDSFQGNNLPNVRKYITAPNVSNLLAIQEFQEIIHQQSYQYILDGIYPLMTRESIYNKWRDSPMLKKRIKTVVSIGEEFLADPSMINFKRILVANYILESLYFYVGFLFFDQLASRNKLTQCSKIIDYIRVDELTHVVLFSRIINELFDMEEEGEWVNEMFAEAVVNETEWVQYVYGDKILGMSSTSSIDYIKYLANRRLKMIKLDLMFPDNLTNPYAHLDVDNKSNFFESTVTDYSRASAVDGWDSF